MNLQQLQARLGTHMSRVTAIKLHRGSTEVAKISLDAEPPREINRLSFTTSPALFEDDGLKALVDDVAMLARRVERSLPQALGPYDELVARCKQFIDAQRPEPREPWSAFNAPVIVSRETSSGDDA